MTARGLPRHQRLSRRWVVLGQSQGGRAAIATASHATEFGGKALDFRGGVGTGTPAYIEVLVSALGPGVPPVDVSPNLTTYVSYILAGMEHVHPELAIDDALTPTGRRCSPSRWRPCPVSSPPLATTSGCRRRASRSPSSWPTA